MFLPALLLFLLCLLFSAFFSSSETAFIAVNPYSLEFYVKKGSRRALLVRKILARLNDLLATILIGNTLVNAAAASLATYIFVTLIPDRNQAVLYATIATTLFILLFSEINPKTYAAHNPLRTVFFASYLVKAFMILFYPFVRIFSFLTRMLVPSSKNRSGSPLGHLNEEEIKIALHSGAKGLSSLRRKMITSVFDIGSRPIKEIMVPRPQVKALEIDATLDEIVSTIQSAGFSRYPVFRSRMDNVEGTIHAKDVIGYLIDKKEFKINSILRKPFFVPELASLEKVLLQMQEKTIHLAIVVDEFGNMDGIVTLEDIIEEIVGEIQDEHDAKTEAGFVRIADGIHLIKGSMTVKETNARLSLNIPEKKDYTTLAGFFLFSFGRIPQEKDFLDFQNSRFTVIKMNKRHISLIRIEASPEEESPSS